MQEVGFFHAGAILGSGVYALLRSGQVVYIGKSRNVLSRVYTHKLAWQRKRQGKKVPGYVTAKPIQFDDVWVHPCPVQDLDAVEAKMVAKYNPVVNVQLRTSPKITGPIPLTIGGVTVSLNGQTFARKSEPPITRRAIA